MIWLVIRVFHFLTICVSSKLAIIIRKTSYLRFTAHQNWQNKLYTIFTFYLTEIFSINFHIPNIIFRICRIEYGLLEICWFHCNMYNVLKPIELTIVLFFYSDIEICLFYFAYFYMFEAIRILLLFFGLVFTVYAKKNTSYLDCESGREELFMSNIAICYIFIIIIIYFFLYLWPHFGN